MKKGQGWQSQVKPLTAQTGARCAGLKIPCRRASWVQIPPPAPQNEQKEPDRAMIPIRNRNVMHYG